MLPGKPNFHVGRSIYVEAFGHRRQQVLLRQTLLLEFHIERPIYREWDVLEKANAKSRDE